MTQKLAIVPVIAHHHRRLECSWKACRLWRDAVRLPIWGWRRGTTRTLRQHKSATNNRCVIIVLLLASLASVSCFVVSSQLLDGGRLLSHVADHERHGEVIETVAPRDLHNSVHWDEVVAGIEHADVAFATANIDEL